MTETHQVLHGTRIGTNPGEPIYNGPYEELAANIVFQAVKDYVSIIRGLWLGEGKGAKKKRAILLEKLELEAFFHSGWYGMLTDIDPDTLIDRCKVLGKQKAREAVIADNKRRTAKASATKTVKTE